MKLLKKFEVDQKLKSKIKLKSIASEFLISVEQVIANSKKEKEITAAFEANEPFSKCRIFKSWKQELKQSCLEIFLLFLLFYFIIFLLLFLFYKCQMSMKILPFTGLLLK